MVSADSGVCVIGDCALDVTAAQHGPLVRGGDSPAAIDVSPGGQGANVAVRLARLGVPVRLVTALARDPAGDWLRARLEAEGVGLAATPVRSSSLVVALLDEAGERTMLSDRATFVAAADALAASVREAGWIHCSGYVLRDPREARPVAGVLAARANGHRVSVAGGSAGDDRAAETLRWALGQIRPDLLVVGLGEARWLVEDPAADAPSAVSRLADAATLVVVTAGEGGADACLAGRAIVHAPAPQDPSPVVDATGAGDAFTAALIAALRDDGWPPMSGAVSSALARASRAGGSAARVPGAQGRILGERGPATVTGT